MEINIKLEIKNWSFNYIYKKEMCDRLHEFNLERFRVSGEIDELEEKISKYQKKLKDLYSELNSLDEMISDMELRSYDIDDS